MGEKMVYYIPSYFPFDKKGDFRKYLTEYKVNSFFCLMKTPTSEWARTPVKFTLEGIFANEEVDCVAYHLTSNWVINCC
jgi:hypothetical protein